MKIRDMPAPDSANGSIMHSFDDPRERHQHREYRGEARLSLLSLLLRDRPSLTPSQIAARCHIHPPETETSVVRQLGYQLGKASVLQARCLLNRTFQNIPLACRCGATFGY